MKEKCDFLSFHGPRTVADEVTRPTETDFPLRQEVARLRAGNRYDRMTSPPPIISYFSLAAVYQGEAPAGEVFLALENLSAAQLIEIWNASFAHDDRDAAVIVEHASASRWADLDIRGMTSAVFRESRSSVQVVQMAATMLNRLPHEEAWGILTEPPNSGATARPFYLASLAVSDPALALRLLPPLERGGYGGDFRENVIKAATRADSSLTLSWLKAKRNGGTDAQAVALELVAANPPMALDVARWLSVEGQDFEADQTAARVFDRWADSDPSSAGMALVQWLGGTEERTPVTSWYTGHDFKEVTGRVFFRWSKVCPPQALESAMSIAPEHIRHVALNSIGIGWANAEDGLCAARALPQADRLAFLELLAPRLAAAKPELLRRELEMMPPPESASAAGAVHAMFENLEGDEAESFKKKYPQWFKDGVPGFGGFDSSFTELFSAITASLESPEKLEASLTRVRKIIDQIQP